MQLSRIKCLGWVLILYIELVYTISGHRVSFIAYKSRNITPSRVIITHFMRYDKNSTKFFKCNAFFGSTTSIFNDSEYENLSNIEEYYKRSDIVTDLPLAPEYEDEDVEDVEEDLSDLTKPPESKDEWALKKISKGRLFWHKFFAEPGEKNKKAFRWLKFTHDRFYCNRVIDRTYTEVHPPLERKNPDGSNRKLTKKERNREKSRIKITKKIIGYDNSSDDSNILILMNYPQSRLVKLVERIRLPGLLDLRNYELLRLLRSTVLYLSKPNTFESIIDFFIAFGRFNSSYDGEYKLFTELKTYPRMRFKPMVYAIIGKLRSNPFPKDLLLPRRDKEGPIRDPFPDTKHKDSKLNKFLTTCITLIKHTLNGSEYNHDETMDRSFSDIFNETAKYTTKGSVNKIDIPSKIEFQKNLQEYLIPNIYTSTINHVDGSQPDVQSTSVPLAESSPPEVTTSVPLGVEPSSNYLSLKGNATPRDRGDVISGGKDVTSSGEPAADLREAEGEVNEEAPCNGKEEGDSKEFVDITSSAEHGSDLRELEGELNRESVCKTISSECIQGDWEISGPISEDDTSNISANTTSRTTPGWTKEDVKNMLKSVRRLGLERVETMVIRFKKLHNDIGFTYEDIIAIGKKNPQIFKFGNYKQHCLQIYDLDERLTHEMVLDMVRKYPNLLTFNIARCIRPKVYYLTRNMCRDVKELLKFPKYLSYSLYDRIIPRHLAIMNKIYNKEYLYVYRYLFHTGYYKSYGQLVTDVKVPDTLPEKYHEHLESYRKINERIKLQDMITTNEEKFCEIYQLTYREVVEAKINAQKITLPTDMF